MDSAGPWLTCFGRRVGTCRRNRQATLSVWGGGRESEEDSPRRWAITNDVRRTCFPNAPRRGTSLPRASISRRFVGSVPPARNPNPPARPTPTDVEAPNVGAETIRGRLYCTRRGVAMRVWGPSQIYEYLRSFYGWYHVYGSESFYDEYV